MASPEPKRRGRPPLFVAQKRITHELHLNMGADVWRAVKDYCEAIGELSVSLAVRRLIRERLAELGYLREGAGSLLSTKNP